MKPKISFISLFTSTIVLFTTSCNSSQKENILYHNNGNIKQIITYTKDNAFKTQYTLDSNSVLKSIEKFNKYGIVEGEQLYFYNSGIIDRKIIFKNGTKEGNAYYFFDTSGALKYFRYFRNDKQVLYGADFWGDSMDVMKSSLHFNDNGQIFYKKNFDENGKFISEEGKKE